MAEWEIFDHEQNLSQKYPLKTSLIGKKLEMVGWPKVLLEMLLGNLRTQRLYVEVKVVSLQMKNSHKDLCEAVYWLLNLMQQFQVL